MASSSSSSTSGQKKPQVTVVIAIDKSPQAEEAFHWYVKSLHNKNNNVLLVHCPENPLMSLTEAEWQKLKDKEKKQTRELIAKYTQLMKDSGIKHTEYKTMHGPKPGEAIIQAAMNANAAFIVVGMRGMGTVRRTVLGSVSTYVLLESEIPVIVCRSHKKTNV